MTPPPLRVNLLGFGTVGRALARLLLARDAASAGDVRVVAITDRGGTLRDPDGVDLHAALAAKRANGSVTAGPPDAPPATIARTVDADVVVDALPTDLRTGDTARAVARAALRAGRDVVTAGKGLLALHDREARALTRETGRRILGSATVLAGTPALELLTHAFRGDRVTRFEGVLNGSTNVLLSRLEDGTSWANALREARDAGLLEADPTMDVRGWDAAAKAVILANHAWGHGWTLADARIDGIDSVDPAEARAARARGEAVRLVATADPRTGVTVAPATLPRDHPLVVHGAENALRIELASAGTVTLRGPGAGGGETAAAVLSDILTLSGKAAGRGKALTAAPVVRAADAHAPER